MADTNRRKLLFVLAKRSPRDLEDAQTLSEIADKDPSVLKTELVHVHVPKLEEAGLVARDHETNEIQRGPQFDEIRPVLELLSEYAAELPCDRS